MKKLFIVFTLFAILATSCTPWHKSKRISKKHNPNKIHKKKVEKVGKSINKWHKSHEKVKKNN
jgi:hypothetical protein